jgi:hypothetical protein
MPEFDRFDICAAHEAMEVEWNAGGWLHERPTNRRRLQATSVQLARLRYRSPQSGFESLSENGQEIYHELQRRYGLFVDPKDSQGQLTLQDVTVPYLEAQPGSRKVAETAETREYSLSRVRFYCRLLAGEWFVEGFAYEADMKVTA